MSDVTYSFHGSAVGIGGVLGGPTGTLLPNLPSVAIGPNGGIASSVMGYYNQGGISFSSAQSVVTGEKISDVEFLTVAEVNIHNLIVFGQLDIRFLRAMVTSRRILPADEPEITFHAEYDRVKVGGKQILAELDTDLFTHNPTYGRFLKAVGSEASLADRQKYEKRFSWDGGVAMTTPPPQMLRASLLQEAKQHGTANAFRRSGYTVPVRNFGKLRFAEVLLKPGHRRLTLLQVDIDRARRVEIDQVDNPETELLSLDSGFELLPQSGTISIASVEGNGTPIWPRPI
jgi:hypothetical protein